MSSTPPRLFSMFDAGECQKMYLPMLVDRATTVYRTKISILDTSCTNSPQVPQPAMRSPLLLRTFRRPSPRDSGRLYYHSITPCQESPTSSLNTQQPPHYIDSASVSFSAQRQVCWFLPIGISDQEEFLFWYPSCFHLID
jgi:hypothetical protein